MTTSSELTHFFKPDSVAIIGSFRKGFFGGYVIVDSLLQGGYKGKIYPVNPNYEQVLGIRVYPSLEQIPGDIDLALIMINARGVPELIKQCADKGVKAAIIIADGFAERNEQGAQLQEQVQQLAKQAHIRLMGPNTAGVVNPIDNFYPCPYEAGYHTIQKGAIALISQTGMTNPQAFPYQDYHCGVSKICDLGNKCDVDECDLLEYLAEDEHTKVVGIYLEGIKDGKRFLRVARAVSSRKPVLIVKSGRTTQGAAASASHTGSMAVNDAIFDAVCAQTGVIRLDTFDELFEVPKIFATQPLPRGGRFGILTITGGMAVMAIDYGAPFGLQLAGMQPQTASFLDSIFSGSGHMPVDIGPMMAAVRGTFSRYHEILDALMADSNVDALLHIPWAHPSEDIIESYVRAYENIRGRYQKPVVTWVYGPSSQAVSELAYRLERMGFPVFKQLETAIKALGLALQYSQKRMASDAQ